MFARGRVQECQAGLASLPTSLREAIRQEDQAAFDQAAAALAPEEQQRVLAALQALQGLDGEQRSNVGMSQKVEDGSVR